MNLDKAIKTYLFSLKAMVRRYDEMPKELKEIYPQERDGLVMNIRLCKIMKRLGYTDDGCPDVHGVEG